MTEIVSFPDYRATAQTLPGADLKPEKMPGHWLLAQLGKKVLRPGGIELTRAMLGALQIGKDDDVVEFAPGLGLTARMALAQQPASYTGVERDADAAQLVNDVLEEPQYECVVGKAEDTGLPDASATVVYGEAMLTMQTNANKMKIISEAVRILKRGGRYAIHEINLAPDDLDGSIQSEISKGLSQTIKVGARPLTMPEWTALLEAAGFRVVAVERAPMHLLEPRRVLADEGLLGTLRFIANVLGNRVARQRVLAMRAIFRRFAEHMAAVMIVAEKVA